MDGWGVEIDPSFRAWVDESDVFEAARRIDCPVLYVHARDDERIPLSVSERLHELTPRSELVVLERGDTLDRRTTQRCTNSHFSWLEGVLGHR